MEVSCEGFDDGYCVFAAPRRGGACAQDGTGDVAGTFSRIPVGARYQPAEAVRTSSVVECEGQRYSIEFAEAAADGPELRRVGLVSLDIPEGPVTGADRVRLETALAPYWLMFDVSVRCRGEVASLTFTGRRRGDVDNSSVVAWFNQGSLTAIR